MTTKEAIAKGHKASELLENVIFREAMEGIKQAIHGKWETCPIRDTEGQHELKLMLKLISDLEINIKRFVDDGKVAKFHIEQEEKTLAKKVRGIFTG